MADLDALADKGLASALASVEQVIIQPDQFKRRLAIGGDVYAARRAWRSLSELWDTGSAAATGASVAKSTAVAATFFAPATSADPLVWMGIMAPAAAVTPVGWVLVTALAAGGAWYGVSRRMASAPDPFVDVIPKFLNTPIDILAMRLLDLHASLAFYVAAVDGQVDPEERHAIHEHFEHEWGYDPGYLDAALPLIEAGSASAEMTELVAAITTFHNRSRDCAPQTMQRELLDFLHDVAMADGAEANEERDTISAIREVVRSNGAISLDRAAIAFAAWTRTLADAAVEGADEVRVRGRSAMNVTRAAMDRIDAELAPGLARSRETVTRILRGLGRKEP